MHANYHTHTWRCGHAKGTEREYIEAAIRGGLRVLGFSDHTPQFFDGDYYPVREKMRPEELEGYVRTLEDLREEYKGEITIHIGLEVEYLPKHFQELLDLVDSLPIEYMIQGQHNLLNGLPGDPFVFRATESVEVLELYVRQTIEGMRTGRFLYLAHPDVLRYQGPEAPYRREMRTLCLAARELDMPLEFNLNGLAGERHYPNPVFWEIAAETGCRAVLGVDAHKPDLLARKDLFRRAEEMVRDFGVPLITDFEDCL